VGTDFGNPDFALLAKSFGCKYFKVEKANDLGAVYEEAINSKGIKIVDVPIDKQKNVALFGD
jgi:acetolactate synthase-1/2/3 large subunit